MARVQVSRTGRVTAFVGDDEYDLVLRIGELMTLEEKRDCGPLKLVNRLSTGDWRIQDVMEIVRLGLIGGGMAPREAATLVDQTIRSGYLAEYRDVALQALYAALVGVPEEVEPVGEPQAPETPEPQTSTGETSTRSPGRRGSRPRTSGK